MNSEIIKFVAGGGKTTFAKKYYNTNKNGIYLAFTNSVVDELHGRGFLCKTLDSFISSYIVPKFLSKIKLISRFSKINIIETISLPNWLKGVGNISIDINGNLHNKGNALPINLSTPNPTLHCMPTFDNKIFLTFIFGKETTNLTEKLRSDLALFVIKNYRNEIIKFLSERFDFIIVDEAQDIKSGHLEEFAKLLYESDIKCLFLGDSNQNINNGSDWFENIHSTDYRNHSFRCPEANCKWIRETFCIDINGEKIQSTITKIDLKNIKTLDDSHRFLLYKAKMPYLKDTVNAWSGPKGTIQSVKGSTINHDVVIVGKTLSTKFMYTAVTRTTKDVYYTIQIE